MLPWGVSAGVGGPEGLTTLTGEPELTRAGRAEPRGGRKELAFL